MDGAGALEMSEGTSLSLWALPWLLICGFPSSFMAKFLVGDRFGFSADPGELFLGHSFVLSLDTLQIFSRTGPWREIDSPKQC